MLLMREVKTPNVVMHSPFLVKAIRRVLAPLVKLLLTKGITYPFLAELLKSVYVDVARTEFQLDTKRLTFSRITVLTGVHREDVRRFAHSDETDAIVPEAISHGARIVTRWISQPEYVDGKKRPVPLPRLASVGGDHSFEALVESVSKNIRPRTVLDEYLRLGIAHLDEKDFVHLSADAFIPEIGLEEKAYYFGLNIHDHMAAAVHNLLGEMPPAPERSLVFEKLSPRSIDTLRALAADLSMQALTKVYKRARVLEKKDVTRQDSDMRLNFGIYFFSEKKADPMGDDPHDER